MRLGNKINCTQSRCVLGVSRGQAHKIGWKIFSYSEFSKPI